VSAARAAARDAGRDAAPAPYRRTQRGLVVGALVASAGVAACVVAARSAARGAMPAGAVAGLAVAALVLVAVAVVFSSLTVTVDAEALRWHFAFGAFRGTLRRADVAAAEPTRTTLLDGVGLRYGPRGWLYNVAVGPAVRVVRRDGRSFRIGTDDPDGLIAALARPSGPAASR
jgi:hypothetical protein